MKSEKTGRAGERYGACPRSSCREYGKLVVFPSNSPSDLHSAIARRVFPPPNFWCPSCLSVSSFLTPTEILALAATNQENNP